LKKKGLPRKKPAGKTNGETAKMRQGFQRSVETGHFLSENSQTTQHSFFAAMILPHAPHLWNARHKFSGMPIRSFAPHSGQENSAVFSGDKAITPSLPIVMYRSYSLKLMVFLAAGISLNIIKYY